MRLPNLPKIEFSTGLFYGMGMFFFLMMALGNSWSLNLDWNVIDVGQRVARIASIGFNLLLVKFFSYLKKTADPTQQPEMLSDADMDKVLNEITQKA